MKTRCLQHAAAMLACVGMLLPPSASAAPFDAESVSRDVALRDGGLLVGQVVDAQGKPLAESDVSVRQGDAEIVRTKTDKNGVFAATGLRGGEYQLVAGGGQATYRLWAAQTAPPAASHGVLMVTGDGIVNGQYYGHPADGSSSIIKWVKSHPFIVAAGIATAIAVPIAVADDDDPSS